MLQRLWVDGAVRSHLRKKAAGDHLEVGPVAKRRQRYRNGRKPIVQVGPEAPGFFRVTRDADFDLDAFEHVARWDPDAEWIEMRLRSTAEQKVTVGALDLTVPFGAGEEMRTEVSAKFRPAAVRAELAAAGFAVRDGWTDGDGRFLVTLPEAV